MEKRFVIDSLSDGQTVLETENGHSITVDAAILPKEAQEGDILRICVDREATEQQKDRVSNLLKDIFS